MKMKMKTSLKMKIAPALLAIAGAMTLASCTVVEDGTVEVATNMGKVQDTELHAGMHFYNLLTTNLNVFGSKELAIDLEDLQPTAKDDTTLAELDITILFQPNVEHIAENYKTLSNSTLFDDERVEYVGAKMALRYAREAAYSTATEFDGMQIPKKRGQFVTSMKAKLDEKLDSNIGTITEVIVRKSTASEEIRNEIDLAVAAKKADERIQTQADANLKRTATEALARAAEARGIAEATQIINMSLTTEYLEYERIQAMKEFAKTGSNTVVIPSNMSNAMLNIDAGDK